MIKVKYEGGLWMVVASDTGIRVTGDIEKAFTWVKELMS